MKEVEELARLLRGAELEELPHNLYAEFYTDLIVEVLDRRKQIVARTFADMSATTHGEAQKRFDAVFEKLQELHERVLREGR